MKMKIIIAGVTAFTMLFMNTLPVNAENSYGKFVWGEDNWQFRNSSSAFGTTYAFTESDRAKLEENLSNIELRMASELIDGEFLGSCYGMATLSILACYDMIDYASYRVYDLPERKGPAVSLYDMTTESCPPTVEMKSLCNYYTALQYTEAIRQNTAWAMYDMTAEQRLRQLIENAEAGIPTMVAYFGSFDAEGNRNGHAVVACDVEYGEYELYIPYTMGNNGLAYIPNEPTHIMNGRIRLYDNAGYEDIEDYLYFNTEDMSWYCKGCDSKEGGTICMTISDVNLLNAGGLLEGTAYVCEKDFLALLYSAAINSEHTLQKISFDNGSWTAIGSAAEEIKAFPVFFGETTTSVSKNYTLTDAESGYVLTVAESEPLDLEMNYENALLIANASAGSQAVFHPSGYLEISGANTEYDLEMVFNDGYYNDSWYDFTISGNANTATLQKTVNGYIFTSDNLQDITATASGDTAKATLTFSTNMNSVLLYEVNETTIGASIDTDGDGTYETSLTEKIEPGDVNADGIFSIADAVMIQKWLLCDGNLTDWRAGDLYKDHVINAFDLCLMKYKLLTNQY